jgi:hypothetical protein
MSRHALTERRTTPPYGPAEALRATIALLRHYRAFLASPSYEMRDPRQWGVYLTKGQARHRLTSLINVAVNRRAGIPDCPSRKHDGDYQRHLRLDANELNHPRLRIYFLRTPELRRRFARRLIRRAD